MKIYPAIDLRDGKCVRLLKGDFSTTYKVAEDPIEVAADFYNCGARYVHMVDLDGALEGKGKNREVVKSVCEKFCGKLQVELGGGIRRMEDLEEVFSLGVSRAVLGSAAVKNPAFLKEALDKYGSKIAVGIDAANGEVMTQGWTEGSGMNYLDFASKIVDLGTGTIIFTDISKDGTLEGPNLEMLSALIRRVNCEITASGGIKDINDVIHCKEIGCANVIIGKAYYAGTVRLEEAVQIGGVQC